MTAPTRFVLLVIGIVVAAAALMAPRRDEWLAVLRDEGDQARIISLLEPRPARQPNDPGLLGTLAGSYAEIHNYQRAIELLERYITLRSDDAEAYASLADLYDRTGSLTKAIAMLKTSIAIKPKLSYAIALEVLYRKEQRADEELALLSQFETELTLESGLLLRLAELRADVGDKAGAIKALMRPEVVSASTPPIQNADARPGPVAC